MQGQRGGTPQQLPGDCFLSPVSPPIRQEDNKPAPVCMLSKFMLAQDFIEMSSLLEGNEEHVGLSNTRSSTEKQGQVGGWEVWAPTKQAPLQAPHC